MRGAGRWIRRLAGKTLLLTLLVAAGCEPSPWKPPQAARGKPGSTPHARAPDHPRDPARAPPDDAGESVVTDQALVQRMLERVASARGLPVLKPVAIRVLDRKAIREHVRAHIDRDVPAIIVAHQGDLLAALELVPAQYDFVAGMLKLVEGRIAGLYDPDDQTMYLADDLSDDEAIETLAHELVHALQDQSFALASRIKFSPGQSDRVAAAHSVIEGDATSAMLDVVIGSAFDVSESALRRLVTASTALSQVGLETPRFLQSSLNAPYIDGFVLVQEYRRRGGWQAVDAVWRAMPETTEQLLHPAKLDAREPAIVLGVPPVEVLGGDFRAVFDDVMGEQGLRMVLEEWSNRERADEAATGWGGDRIVVARRDLPDPAGAHEIAVGWHLRMDTPKDAAQVETILRTKLGERCRERPALGPIAWTAKGRDIAVAAGPFVRDGRTAAARGSCKGASQWAGAMLKTNTWANGKTRSVTEANPQTRPKAP